jgi:hypothetical protein
LTVESVSSGATSMGCNADARAADAFFKFTVTRQTEVTVDTEESALDTVLAIYPGDATVFGTNYTLDAFAQPVDCDDDGGETPGASRITATLAAGDYYAVVKGRNAPWGGGNATFNLSVRDHGATRAITCAGDTGANTPRISQTLPAGDYVAVLTDTQNAGQPGSGGAYSITFTDVDAAGQETGMPNMISCATGTITGAVTAGEDYYVVVKGNTATDAGNYTLTVEDAFSTQAEAGSTPISCAAEGGAIDAVYPPGEYFAVVTGQNTDGMTNGEDGPYELTLRDVDPFSDYNRLACAGADAELNAEANEDAAPGTVAEAGPNGTSVIEADLEAGTHYVVVKGDGAGQTGSYRLNIRDVDAHPDHRLACANGESEERLEYDVVAGRDYTVLLKGDAAGEQGAYNLKLYDEIGLQGGAGQRLACQTICPPVAPYESGSQSCTSEQRSVNYIDSNPAPGGGSALNPTWNLGADTYYLTVKGRRAAEKGFYELQIGDPAKGAPTSASRYTPPTWNEVHSVLTAESPTKPRAKILPVVSCDGNSVSGLCAQTLEQAGNLAAISGALAANGVDGLVQTINPNGTGIGSKLAMSVRDLANHLAMDIKLLPVNHPVPGFDIVIQKCTGSQAGCTSHSQGCATGMAQASYPANVVGRCTPGATPKFLVQFTNPAEPNSVDPNPNDPNGGYHFELQIIGNNTYLLDKVPVYIIPTDGVEPSVDPPPAGAYQTSGTYEQEVFGAGCNYYLIEGESTGAGQGCADNMDNNNNNMMMVGGIDRGVDADMNGNFTGPMDTRPDPGCMPASCLDGIDNDNDGNEDVADADCNTTERQDWTDLFFDADIPPGTSVDFDMCTANSSAALDTECVSASAFSRIARVTSMPGTCFSNADCQDVDISGTVRDGFCGAGGECQFITPPKVAYPCSSDAACPNGDYNGEFMTSSCVAGECRFASPPAEITDNLMRQHQGRPYVKMKITLRANNDASATPTLYDWYLTYECRAGL